MVSEIQTTATVFVEAFMLVLQGGGVLALRRGYPT